IAFIRGRDTPNPQIYIISVEGGEAAALTHFPEGSIRSFKWAPDGKSLAVAFRELDSDFTTESGRKRKEEGLSDPPRIIEDLIYRLDGDGYFNGRRFQLYIVDLENGRHRRVYDKDTLGEFDYDWSPTGREIVLATNRDRRAEIRYWKSKLLILDVKTNKLRELPGVPIGVKGSVAWSPNGRWIAYAGQDSKTTQWGSHNTHLFLCDSKKGGVKKLTAGCDRCLGASTLSDTCEVGFEANMKWSADSKKLFCRIGWHGDSYIASITLRGGDFTFLTRAGANWDFGNLSADGRFIAGIIQTHTRIGEVHLFDLTAAGAGIRALTDFNGKFLKGVQLARPEEVWLESPDGAKVHSWILKPPGFQSGRTYPAVLEVHGGPSAQYGSTFFHEFQVLAAAGYVVFFSNPRGSKGYGESHTLAIKGDWGNRDWIDIQTVKDYMKAQPYVDSKRLAIMGGSYGGYMTNWAIGHTHDFAAAITDRCVSNMISMTGSSDIPTIPDEYWEGSPWDRPETLWQQSPLAHFKIVKTPTLIIHSEGDLRCNIEQGEQVFTALKLLNVPTRLVRYPRSTFHGMSRGGPVDLRCHRLHQILNWLKTYLK
ncbi:MAG: S9 family peptidase, partial [Acidobacteriota bacterium]